MEAEESHETGREGAYRAKVWLESTTRLAVPWTSYDLETAPYLRILRPDGTAHRFDLAGHFLDSAMGGRRFLAEVKNYTLAGAQGAQYARYLADCYYATLQFGRDYPLEFMWITWHPFRVTNWTSLCGDKRVVRAAISDHSHHLCGRDIDDEFCEAVADRLWLIVLSTRQERDLVPTSEMVAHIRSIEIRRALS